MKRLLQQHETIKQTMTGLRNQLELAVDEMQQYNEGGQLSTINAKIDLLQKYNEDGPDMKEVRLQHADEGNPFAYLAVYGSDGTVYKLCERMSWYGPTESLVVNELKAPLTLYLNEMRTWTIVAIGSYQDIGFLGKGFKVDGVKQLGHTYVLPSSLEKPDGGNLWQLSWD